MQPDNLDGDEAESMLLDQIIKSSILVDMNNELKIRILHEFERDISRYLRLLANGISSKNIRSFENATHGLKGVSGTFGATKLQILSMRANSLARTNEFEDAFDMGEEIKDAARAVVSCLNEWRARRNMPDDCNSGVHNIGK